MNSIKKILIVEDFYAMRNIITQSFKSIGYSDLVTAANGIEAFKILQNQKIDLMISDLNMPAMDGFELLRKVRANEKLKYLPVLIITGESIRENILRVMIEGANGILIKPFTLETFKKKIESIIHQKSTELRTFNLNNEFIIKDSKNESDTFNENLIGSHDTILFPSDNSKNIQQEIESIEKQSKPTYITLVFSNSLDNIKPVIKSLEHEYRVEIALNKASCLSIVNTNSPPDMILLDVTIPDLDAYDICKEIKENLLTNEIPIIFLSSNNQTSEIVKGFDLGCIDYICTPIEPEVLRVRVKTYLAQREYCEKLKLQINSLMETAKLRENSERTTQHDLRNPLSAIMNHIGLFINDSQFSQSHRRQFKSINYSAQLAMSMINGSLNIYRMERGDYPFNPIDVNITLVINNVISNFKEFASNLGVSLKVKGFTRDDLIFGEEFLCVTIISNLLKNAIEASPIDGLVQISIESKDHDVLIRIYNDGVINDSIKKNLFSKYVTTNKNEGIGLGTYSAKLMTLVQGGTINFDIIDNKKTVFTVTLPRPM